MCELTRDHEAPSLGVSHKKAKKNTIQAASSEAGIPAAPGSQMTCTNLNMTSETQKLLLPIQKWEPRENSLTS